MEDLTGYTIYRPDRELTEDTDMTTALASVPISCKEIYDFKILTTKAPDYTVATNEDDPRARKPLGPLRERWTGRPITPGPFMFDKLGDDHLTMFQAHEPTPSKYALYLKPGGLGESEFNPVPKEPSPPTRILNPEGEDLPPPIQRTRWWSGPARDPSNILNEKCPKIIDQRRAEREEKEAKRAARSPKKQPRRRVSISTIPVKTSWSSSDEDDGSLSPKPRSLSPVSYRRPALFMRSPTIRYHMNAKDGSFTEIFDDAGEPQDDEQEELTTVNVDSDYPRTGYFPRPDSQKPEKLVDERKTVILKPSRSESPHCSPLFENELDGDSSSRIKEEEDEESIESDSKRWLGTPKTTTTTSRRSKRVRGTPYCFLYGNSSDTGEDIVPIYPKVPSPWRQDVIAIETEQSERARLRETNPWAAPDSPKVSHFATNPAPPTVPVRYGDRPIYAKKVDLFTDDPESLRPLPVKPLNLEAQDKWSNTVDMHPSILKKCPDRASSPVFSPECQCKHEPILMPDAPSFHPTASPCPKQDRSRSPVPAPIGPFLRTYVPEPEIKPKKELAAKQKDSFPHEIWPDGRYKMLLPIPLRKTSEQKIKCCEEKVEEKECKDKPQEEPPPPRVDAELGPWPADRTQDTTQKENPAAPFMFECAQCPRKDMSVDIGPAVFTDAEIEKMQKASKKGKILRYSVDPSDKNPMNRYGQTLPVDKRNIMICKFCKFYVHEPRMLPCMHLFCSECLKRHFIRQKKGEPAFCPICNTQFCFPQHGVNGFIRAYWLDRMMDYGRRIASYRKGLCVNSKGEITHPYAEFKCKECKVDFCLECDHRHRKQYLSHRSRNIEDIVKETLMNDFKSHQFTCAKHSCVPLEFFCQFGNEVQEKRCKKAICKQCADSHKSDGHDVMPLSKAANIFRDYISAYEKEQFLKVEREIDAKIKLLEWYKRELYTANRHVHEIITIRERKARAFVYALQKKLQDKLACLCQTILRENQEEKFSLWEKYLEWKHLELKCVTIRTVAMKREIGPLCVDANNYVKNIFLWLPNSPKYSRILYGESMEFDRAFVTLGCMVRKRKFLRKYKALASPVESIAAYQGKKSIVIFSIHRSFIKNKKSTVYVTTEDRDEREEWRKMLKVTCKRPFSVACVQYENKNSLAIVDRIQNVGPTEPRSMKDMNLTWVKNRCGKAKPRITILTHGKDPIKIKKGTMFNPLCIAPIRKKNGIIYANAGTVEYNPSIQSLKSTCDSQNDKIVYYKSDLCSNQLEWPECLCTDSHNNIIILDTVLEKIYFMNSLGKITRSYFIPIGGEKNVPGSIAVDRYDNIYVSYKEGHRVDRLYPNGDFECQYLTDQDGVQNPTSLCCFGDLLLVGEASGHVGLYAVEKTHNKLKVFGVDSRFKLERKIRGTKSVMKVSSIKSTRFA